MAEYRIQGFAYHLKKDTDETDIYWEADSAEKLESFEQLDVHMNQPHPLYPYCGDEMGDGSDRK